MNNPRSLCSQPASTPSPAVLGLMAMIPLAACGTAWETLPSLPQPDGGAICSRLGEEIVVAGGTNWPSDVKNWIDHIWAYHPKTKTWREAGRLPFRVAYAVQGIANGDLYFAGGSDGTKTHTSLQKIALPQSVLSALQTKTVAPIEPNLVYASAEIIGNELFCIGGAADAAKLETISNACVAIDLLSGKSRKIASLPIPGFAIGTAVACAGKLYVFGGAHWSAADQTVSNLSETCIYSPKTDRWEKTTPHPFHVRGAAAVTLDAKHIYVAGGYKSEPEGFTAEAFIFNVESLTFQQAPPLPIQAGTSLVLCDGFVYCIGGEDRKKHRSDLFWRIPAPDLLRSPSL